jgi:hypothetical protein
MLLPALLSSLPCLALLYLALSRLILPYLALPCPAWSMDEGAVWGLHCEVQPPPRGPPIR